MSDGKATISTHIRIAVDLTPDGIPLVREKAIEVRQEVGGKLRVSRNVQYNYNCRIVRDVPEREFSLSAYGLPEPPGVKFEKPTPRYVWLLAAAGGCAVLAVGFRHLARRRAAVLPPAA